MPSRIALLLVAIAAACQPTHGTTAPPSLNVSAPPTAPSADSSAPAGALCAGLPERRVADLAGASSATLDSATDASCTFTVVASSTYKLNVRVEDTFSDIGAVRSAFAGGEDVAVDDVMGYWSPDVNGLWFDSGHGFMAVQLVLFNGSNATAKEIASAIARELLAAI